MNRTLLLFFSIFLFCWNAGKAQEKEVEKSIQVSDSIRPEYPGGKEKFYRYIEKGIKKRHLPSKSGKIIVYFVVEKDGSLSNIKIVQGIEQKVDDRVVELVKESPKWSPAMINGRVMRASYSLPITINIHK